MSVRYAVVYVLVHKCRKPECPMEGAVMHSGPFRFTLDKPLTGEPLLFEAWSRLKEAIDNEPATQIAKIFTNRDTLPFEIRIPYLYRWRWFYRYIPAAMLRRLIHNEAQGELEKITAKAKETEAAKNTDSD